MQKDSKIKTASAYALALFEAAKDHKDLEKVYTEAEILKESFEHNADLWDMLAAPINNKENVIDTLSVLADKMKLSVYTKNTLLIMAENNRLGLLKTAIEVFEKTYYKDKGIIEVAVDTAVELTKTQDEKLKKVLEKKLNASVLINYNVKPAVLGGLAIRYNDILFDDTISTKLNKIEKIMKGSNVDK